MDEGTPNGEKKVDDNRRGFLKATVVASAALAIGGMAAIAKVAPETGGVQPTTSTQITFPRFLIKDVTSNQTANISSLTTTNYITFNYPLDNEPNILVKLGVSVDEGVGPDHDIVAYSDICQHLGCNPAFVYAGGPGPFCDPSYAAKGPQMYCCCHGSIYDLTQKAKVVGGPAPRPVPRVMLEVEEGTGNIYATGMTGPTIYGHGPAGSDDVSYDLQGGTPVA